ncbi:plasmid stabilization protein [Sphingomonas sp. H39-1-10]|uniref:FitA-like ribbon-helix-helix domain-containing protein n=1 Tax=Sphingomonas pollutisoli TaxID=3030829 RepID=UPI0023B921A5|nr:plasmid stabilization protein [Sphingomonas pollutisoli]MDF0491628.1 plasmid stabilization protein [Sphingomonas pollutisoli]
MPALTIRNIPDDIHRGLKALAAKHGRSAEAEVRELIASAVFPSERQRLGSALGDIWGGVRLTEVEARVIDRARDRVPAKPMSLGE